MSATRAVLVANGQIRDDRAARAVIQSGELLIAADGGARHLARLGFTPHIVVGDMDSLTDAELAQLQAAGAGILRYPAEKDETDLELAIAYALEQGCTVLRIVAALGDRIDQTLANIFLLDYPGLENIDARLDDGREEVFLVRDRALISGGVGDGVSLLPIGGAAHGVATHGLRYPLQNETLYPERSRGVSNEMLAALAEIQVVEGKLICIHTRQEGTYDQP